MFKLLVFLCAGLFATMYVLGRDGGPVRDGLAGKVTPLMQDADSPEREAAPRVILAAATKPAAAAKPAPEPVAAAQPEPPEPVVQIAAPATEAVGESGLTLALPLVEDGTEAPAPQAVDPEAAEPGDPTVMYVSATSVNVRSGPSAETQALTRLPQGEAVTVLPSDTPGWSMIRIEGDGIEGFIASRFLSESSGPRDGFMLD
jgi:uncharacterized protein YgiM (DUF1202 family)